MGLDILGGRLEYNRNIHTYNISLANYLILCIFSPL